MTEPARLLILAHDGSWDKRFQVTSLATSEAASGQAVDLALFFAALHCWVEDDWDRLDPSPPLDADTVERLGLPSLTSLLQESRDQGNLHLYACSASVRLLDLDRAATQGRVDAILGWQSFSRMIRRASQVVTL